MQRVSGVTVQDGKYVFVRGLGGRYATTALNGGRLPSPEPERTVVPLDLFPARMDRTPGSRITGNRWRAGQSPTQATAVTRR